MWYVFGGFVVLALVMGLIVMFAPQDEEQA